jgi:hypothetical protein
MDAPRRYSEELKSELGFYATWTPSDPIALGSFGTFVNGVFRKAGSLSDLGIEFVRKVHATRNSFKRYRGMKFQSSARASANAGPVDASLGVVVQAERAYAWAFGADGARLAEIEDILQVETAVLRAHDAGLWKGEWLLVTEVQEVEKLNVVIAKSESASGEISAKATVASAADVLLAGDVSYKFASDDVFIVENAKHTTPLFGLRKLRGMFKKGVRPIAGGLSNEPRLALERTGDEALFAD